jgi:hypothetical protein
MRRFGDDAQDGYRGAGPQQYGAASGGGRRTNARPFGRPRDGQDGPADATDNFARNRAQVHADDVELQGVGPGGGRGGRPMRKSQRGDAGKENSAGAEEVDPTVAKRDTTRPTMQCAACKVVMTGTDADPAFCAVTALRH